VAFVEEESHGKISDLLFRVFVGRYQVHGFEMPKIDIPSEYVYVKKLSRMVRKRAEYGAVFKITLHTYFFL